jgi:phage/plasmid primase-like uncharacterized protein
MNMAFDFAAIRRDYPLEAEVAKTVRLRRAGGNKSGVCPFHPDKSPSFVVYPDNTFHCFGCGAHGDVIDYVGKINNLRVTDAIGYLTGNAAPVLDAEDRAAWRIEKERQERERDANMAAASATADRRWQKATTVNGASHPYLDRKNIAPHGARQEGQWLLIPVTDAAGAIQSVQAIPSAEGERKLFHAGAPVAGGRYVIGELGKAIVIGEGFATCATINEVTGLGVVVAFSKGNIARLVEEYSKTHRVIIAADTDAVELAHDLATKHGASVAVPDMAGTEGSDFNDQCGHFGADDVKAVFDRLLSVRRQSPLPLEWFDEIHPQLEANWLVDDMIPAQALCLVYGHPGCGKSFFALDMAMHVAQGAKWRDRDVQQGLVVYIGAEGQRGLRQRVTAFKKHHGMSEMPFALIPVEVNLLHDHGDLEKVMETIEIAAERYGLPVAMTVIDTLARTFGGGDEIGSDMVTYVNNVGHIQARFNCTTMVIHHRPKDSANETPRGHGSLWGACDTILLVEDMGGIKQAKVTKQKDAEAGPPALFTLQVVELGEDEKGRPVTSCIVVPSDTELMQTGPSIKLSDGQRIALDQLQIAIDQAGGYADHNVPENAFLGGRSTRVVRVSEWLSRTTSAMAGPDKDADTLARTIRRYRERLQKLQIIGIHGDFVWINS